MSQVAAQNWQHTPRAGESKVAARARGASGRRRADRPADV